MLGVNIHTGRQTHEQKRQMAENEPKTTKSGTRKKKPNTKSIQSGYTNNSSSESIRIKQEKKFPHKAIESESFGLLDYSRHGTNNTRACTEKLGAFACSATISTTVCSFSVHVHSFCPLAEGESIESLFVASLSKQGGSDTILGRTCPLSPHPRQPISMRMGTNHALELNT